jgi:biotin carboxyl carrier protein
MGRNQHLEDVVKLRAGTHIHDVVRRSADRFEVDGVRVEARVAATATSRFEGRTETRRTPVFVVRDGDQVFAQVGERSYHLTVVSRAALASSHDSAAPGSLDAPMPGRVTRVNVAVGESVKRGQELIVVEAMKMENALVAPNDGIVKSLVVKVGDMVAPGPALIVIEATS